MASQAQGELSHNLESVFQAWNEDGSLIVLVLVGLIASGKVREELTFPNVLPMFHQTNLSLNSYHNLFVLCQSSFAQALETHYPQFRRCNQDDLGNRAQVERLARQSLREGLSVCIDRTNFDHA